jgi:DNA-3-methyladenine glycosylase II
MENRMNNKFTLPVVSPFRLDYTVWALRRRKNNSIDQWDERQYSRILIINNDPVKISIDLENSSKNPALRIFLKGKHADSFQAKEDVRILVRRMLGLDLDLQPFYALLDTDEVIGALVKQFVGVKPPRFPSLFEALVNAIACQQVTLDVGILMLNRLTEKFGVGFDDDGMLLHAFPRAEDLAPISEEEIKMTGFSQQKARAIKELAIGVVTDQIKQTELEEMTNEEAVEYLSTLRGFGRWSAEYVLLRGLGRVDTFPGDDVGAHNNLQRLFHLGQKPGYEEIKKLTSRWHPYEGLVYFHLLLSKLNLKGVI